MAKARGAPEFDASFRERLHDLFVWRRDVRRFRSERLPEGVLERLIGEACLAPSVGLSQPWRFVIVDDPTLREAVVDNFIRANDEALNSYQGEQRALYARLKLAGLREAPAHLAIFVDETTSAGHGLGRNTMPEMLRYSAVAAICQLWLAARAQGVGMGWVSILEPVAIGRVLRTPEGWTLIGYFCLGYPEDESDEPELQHAGWEQPQVHTSLIVRR